MPINFTNKDEISAFVDDNIELINTNIKEFSKKKHEDLTFDKTDICRFLRNKFADYIAVPGQAEDLLSRFEAENYTKSKIKEIAIAVGLYHADLEKYYQSNIFETLSLIDNGSLSEIVANTILDRAGFTGAKRRYGKSQIKSIIGKALYLAARNGFTFNLGNAEEGIMTANAGDSAQFLFLARAILAGYNCSNVDVRSSRYDAVIDKNGHLYRVQVKGISNNTLQFKDRDRGGRGIDPANDRNRGRRITSEDCDLYVAVDKQLGICYIIPTTQIEAWNTDSKSTSEASEYKENWNVIDQLAAR